jgi:hypothetical protein
MGFQTFMGSDSLQRGSSVGDDQSTGASEILACQTAKRRFDSTLREGSIGVALAPGRPASRPASLAIW